MAVNDPTTHYGWDLPVDQGSTDAWGTLLNEAIGEAVGALIESVDTVLGLLEDEIDAVATDVDDLDARVEALTNTPVYARVYRQAASQTVPDNTPTVLEWDTEAVDEGGVFDAATSTSKLVIPFPEDGLYQIRAVVRVPLQSTDDDGREWEVRILKNGAPIASADFPWRHDGHVAGLSGEQTLVLTTLDAVSVGDEYQVDVRQRNPDVPSDSFVVSGFGNSYFEIVRLPSESSGLIYETICWTQYTSKSDGQNFFANASTDAEWSKLWWSGGATENSIIYNTALAGSPCDGEFVVLLDPPSQEDAGAYPDVAADVLDVDVLIRVQDAQNDGTNYLIWTRADPAVFVGRGIGIRVNNFNNTLEVVRASGGTITEVTEGVAGIDLDSFGPGSPYWLRVQVFGSTIRARAWDPAGAEPGTWDVEKTDLSGNDLLSGAVGFWTDGGSQSTFIYQFTVSAL